MWSHCADVEVETQRGESRKHTHGVELACASLLLCFCAKEAGSFQVVSRAAGFFVN